MQKLLAAATLDQFQHIFLDKCVQPSDPIEARVELQKLTQAKQSSVEAYVAAFVQTRSRISLGTSVDSSTQAQWFLNGLRSGVRTVLTTTATVAVLNDIEQLQLRQTLSCPSLSLRNIKLAQAKQLLSETVAEVAIGINPILRTWQRSKL